MGCNSFLGQVRAAIRNRTNNGAKSAYADCICITSVGTFSVLVAANSIRSKAAPNVNCTQQDGRGGYFAVRWHDPTRAAVGAAHRVLYALACGHSAHSRIPRQIFRVRLCHQQRLGLARRHRRHQQPYQRVLLLLCDAPDVFRSRTRRRAAHHVQSLAANRSWDCSAHDLSHHALSDAAVQSGFIRHIDFWCSDAVGSSKREIKERALSNFLKARFYFLPFSRVFQHKRRCIYPHQRVMHFHQLPQM